MLIGQFAPEANDVRAAQPVGLSVKVFAPVRVIPWRDSGAFPWFFSMTERLTAFEVWPNMTAPVDNTAAGPSASLPMIANREVLPIFCPLLLSRTRLLRIVPPRTFVRDAALPSQPTGAPTAWSQLVIFAEQLASAPASSAQPGSWVWFTLRCPVPTALNLVWP